MSADVKEAITGNTLKRVLLKFFPQQLLKDVDLSKLGFDNSKVLDDGGKKLLRNLLSNSRNRLEMYGSFEDVTSQLFIFRNFTSSHRYFGSDLTEKYLNTPKVYPDFHGNHWILKQDLIICLQVIGLEFTKTEFENKIMMIFLKDCEEKLNGCAELVMFGDEDEHFSRIRSNMVLSDDDDKMIFFEDQSSFEAIFQEWKRLIPGWTEQQYEPIRQVLLEYFDKYPIGTSRTMNARFLKCCEVMIKALQNEMRLRPELYLPFSETKTSHHMPYGLRAFTDNVHRFVMTSELCKARNTIYPEKRRMKCNDPDGILSTIPINSCQKLFEDRIDKVEFACVTIVRTHIQAVPILTPTGDYCIQSFEALYHIFRRLIHVVKILRKIEKELINILYDFFKFLVKEMKMDTMKCRYFVTTSLVESIETKAYEHFKHYETIPAKRMGKVGKTGFDLKFLNEQLRNMKLHEMFPDIFDHSKKAYDSLFSHCKKKDLTTADLYRVIQECQFLVFMKIIKTEAPAFFHYQTICTEVYKKCELCQNGVEFEQELVLNLESVEEESSKGDPVERTDSDKIEELEKKLVQQEETMAGLKKSLSVESQERGELNAKIFEYKEYEKKYLECETNMTNSMDVLKEKTCQLEDQLKQERQKTQRMEEERNVFEMKYEKEVSEKSKIMKSQQDSEIKIEQLKSELKQEKQKTQKNEKEVKQQKLDSKQKLSVMEEKYKKETLDKEKDRKMAEQKSAERVNRLESQLKEEREKIQTVEREARQTRIQMENLNTEVLRYQEMIQLNDVVIGSLEDEVEKNKRFVEEMAYSQSQMTSRNVQLESLLENEKEKTQELARAGILQLQRFSGNQSDVNLEETILEKDRVINELREKNDQLSARVDEQERTIQRFFNHFGQIKTEFSSAETQTVSTNASEYTGTRHSLLRLQKIKDTFWHGNQIKTAKEMMKKLISMSNRSEIHQFANYELQQFETNIHNYVQEVERNIQKMKRTNDPMEMTSLPQPPSLSDRFMNEYWSEIDKERNKMKDSSGISTASECLICFEEMKQEEKTLKCNECKKETHMNCASQWLSVHRSCPHCRKELLDPDEFPPLS